jgi:hypothetical protein
MHKNAIRYRDTWAAPGSQLFEAVINAQHALAERIYRECEKRLTDEQKLPEADGFCIDDGYGVVGCGWECTSCGHQHMFERLAAGELVRCAKCRTAHVSTDGVDDD